MKNNNLKIKKLSIFNNVVNLCKELFGGDIPTRPQTLGVYGELLAYKFFKERNSEVKQVSIKTGRGDYDLLVDGTKIEVKTALKNKMDRYTFIFIRNYKSGKALFDKALLVFLESIESKPRFMLIENKDIKNKTGLNGKLDYFRNIGEILCPPTL